MSELACEFNDGTEDDVMELELVLILIYKLMFSLLCLHIIWCAASAYVCI